VHGQPIAFPPILRRGKPNECHGNCIALFDQDPTLIVMSGFGLADDNKWYHRSWCVQDADGEKLIIETVGVVFKPVMLGSTGSSRSSA